MAEEEAEHSDASSSYNEGGDDQEEQFSEDEHDDESRDDDRPKKPKKIHKLSLTETENFNEKLKKRGVIYIARIPPKMTPTKVKALLQEFGEVTRVATP